MCIFPVGLTLFIDFHVGQNLTFALEGLSIQYTVYRRLPMTDQKKRCSLSTAFPAFVYRMSHNRPFYRCAVPIMALVSLVKIKPLACCLSHWLGRSIWLTRFNAFKAFSSFDTHPTADRFWQPLLRSTALFSTCHFAFCQFSTRFESFFENLKLIESQKEDFKEPHTLDFFKSCIIFV